MTGSQAWKELLTFAQRSKYPESTTRALRETVLTYVWPRLDAGVSKSMGHLSKTLFSVHPKTGRICIPLSDPMKFKAEDCPTVQAVIAQDHANGYDRFLEAVKGLASFARRIKLSPSEKWSPPTYNLVGHKRARDAGTSNKANEWMYTDRSRFCAGVTRIFFATASVDDPTKVSLYFYTVLNGEKRGSCVEKIYPGYAPPYRADNVFHEHLFYKGTIKAAKQPGTRVECDMAYVCVLFSPDRKDREVVVDRIESMRERLLEPQLLCTIGSEWDEDAISSALRSCVYDVWSDRYIYLS